MPCAFLLAAATLTNAAPSSGPVSPPAFGGYGVIFWVLLLLSGAAMAVVIERVLLYRREQINFTQFLAGVRTVLKRDNVLEALSICDATPGPVARLVKAAILARDGGREKILEAIMDSGRIEMPLLEARLPFLATVAQVAPLLGVLGTLLGFAGVFRELRRPELSGLAYGYAAPGEMFDGVLQSLYAASLGVGLAVICHAAHNYLVAQVDALQRDLERAGNEAVKLLSSDGAGNGSTPAAKGPNPSETQSHGK